uniref:CCHC-type domain-containing protein n=1 Tax=Tanacetum cinerariifolium TaxID=118510 RepID=A0A6L2KWE8_TANCI|nr:hypothetical protein [Tanacetum cinerariifolium]
MESPSPQVVSAAKLPIPNPNKFDLWKMRVEQIFLMTDYSLWEVILNGDSPAPTRVIEGVLQPVTPTTAEQRLARKNELKAHGTLLMALPDKHQLKFNTHKDAKTLMEAIEKMFGGNTETNKKLINQLEILGVYLSQEDINLKFLRSLPTKWRTHTLIWRNKTDLEEKSLDDLFNSLKIYEVEVKISFSIDADDLEEMDHKWQMVMLTVECYNCHMKGHFARECRSPKDTRRNGAAEPQRRNVPLGTSTSNALVSQCDGLGYNTQVFTRSIFDCDDYLTSGGDEGLPPSPIYGRYQSGDGYHVVPPPYTRTFMPPKPDLVFHNAPNDVETVHTAFNIDLSPTKLDNDLSYTHRPSAPIIKDWVSDLEDESETKIPQNKMAQPTARNHSQRGNHIQYARMTFPIPQRHMVPTAVLTQSKLVPITAVRSVNTTVPKTSVTRPKQAKTVITKPNSPPRRHINRSPSPKASTFPLKVTAAKATMVNAVKGVQGKWEWKPKCLILDHGNPQHALKDKGVIDSGCSRHIKGNMSYLSDFEELNGGYVSFGGNPKGGKISSKDENQVLLRVPRENNMYNVDIKNIVLSGDLTCLFAKETIDESNLWHRRLVHINFKTMNKLVKDFKDFSDNNINKDNAAGTQVPVVGKLSPNNTNTFSVAGPSNVAASPTHRKYSYADFTNLETTIIVSPIPTTRVHKDHHVTQIIGDLSLATQTRSMTRVAKDQGGLSQINNDDFHRFDLPHGKGAIGTKWVFRNKKDERGILVREKHRLVAQGHNQEEGIDYEEVFALVARIESIRLFLAYASFMGFMVYQMDVKSAFLYGTIKEKVYFCQPSGFEDPDYPDKVYKVVKELYGLHQAPRAWYETLANYLLENGFQRGKINQTLFIKRQKDKFQMNSMGELTFFLGLQVKKKKDGIFISQDKYVAEILRKFGLTDGKSASTPIDTEKPLLKDPDGEDIDVHTYKSMIGSLMYLTSSRPDIMFAKVSDITRLQALVDKKKVVITEATIRDALRLDDAEGIECLPNEEIFIEVGKGCSGVETLVFEGMIVEQQVGEGVDEVHVPAVGVDNEGDASAADDEVVAAVDEPSIMSPTPPTQPPPPSEDIPSTSQIAQAVEITKLKQRVKKLERKNKASNLKRLKKVGTAQRIKTSDDIVMDDVSKHGRMIANMDADVDVTLKDFAKDV